MNRKSDKKRGKQGSRRFTKNKSFFFDSKFEVVILLLSIIVVYGRTAWFSVTEFDDTAFMVASLSHWSDLPKTFVASASADTYRPVLYASVILNNVLFPGSITAFHVANILIHGCSCVLLLFFLRSLIPERRLAFFLTIFFAIHPLLTQAVAWIPGRNDSLLTVFCLGSLLCFRVWVEKRTLWALSFHWLLMFIALCTKETAIFLPLIFSSYSIFFTGKWNNKTIALPAAGWLLCLLGYAVLRISIPAVAQYPTMQYSYGLEALLITWRSVPELIGKIFFPFATTSPYPTYSLFITAWGCLSLTLIIYAPFFFRGLHTGRYWFGVAWCIALLLPPLFRQQIPAIEFLYLEHRMYLPMIGILLVFTEYIRTFIRERFHTVILSLLCGFLGIYTMYYSGVFRDPETLWRRAIADNKTSAGASHSLAYSLVQKGSPSQDEIRFLYEQAVQRAPYNARYHSSLGAYYGRMGDFEAAIQELGSATSLDSTDIDAIYNFALAVEKQTNSNTEEPKSLYERVIQRNPQFSPAYLSLINWHVKAGQFRMAWNVFEQSQQQGIVLESQKPGITAYLTEKLRQSGQ